MITICLHGPESTGKSTLAVELAAHFHTIAVPEFGRLYCEALGNDCDVQDLRAIRVGHDLLVREARRKVKRLLILDTDAVMTALWADWLLDNRPADLDRVDDPADLYLLCNIDIPFRADAIRLFPDPAQRQRMFEQTRDELVRRALPFVTISGARSQRLGAALEAVSAHFPELA